MDTLLHRAAAGNADFQDVLEPFLRQPGLPFADILDAAAVDQAFRRRDALFACDDVFSTPVVLWAFLAQVLRDGKGAACAAAVADIATYSRQTGRRAPAGDTGDYCRARAKLHPAALRDLVGQLAGPLDRDARPDWLWRGRIVKLVDGFTFTMPDTPDNQRAFPQQNTQAPGVGLPIARACAVLSLTTAAIHDAAFGPYQGKGTGETAPLREIIDNFDAGDIVLFDRYYCSYRMPAMLTLRGVDVCTRLHQMRPDDFRDGRRLGPCDRLVTWTRPPRPSWMTPTQYLQIPETLTLRRVHFDVDDPASRTESMTVVTTLTDPAAYSAEDIAELYGCRWNVELDIRDIKQTLGLDHTRCKSPEMIERELWVTLLAYNLIRMVIAAAAAAHGKQPRRIGFTLACQTILSSWMLLSTGACRDAAGLAAAALRRIAANQVANRPGRIEPRVIKRRRHRYPLMKKPRDVLRAEIGMS